MLEEILLALLGYHGSVIVLNTSNHTSDGNSSPRFELAKDFESYVNLGDVNLINRIVTLGYYYKVIKTFADRTTTRSLFIGKNEAISAKDERDIECNVEYTFSTKGKLSIHFLQDDVDLNSLDYSRERLCGRILCWSE